MRVSPRHPFTIAAVLFTLLPCVPGQAQVLRQVTDIQFDRMSAPEISDDGSETFVITNDDPLGTNPRRAFQVFSFDSLTGTPTQITHFPEGVEYFLQGVSVTGDGRQVAFASVGDLAGNNADASPEIFLMNRDSGEIVQLTDDPTPNAGSIRGLALAAGGSRVVFASTSDPLGTNPAQHPQVFVAEVDGSGVTQLTSLAGDEPSSLGIDGTGERIVFERGPHVDWLQNTCYAMEADGGGLRTFGAASEIRLSTDGGTLAYEYDPPGLHNQPIVVVQDWEWDWGSTTPTGGDWQEPGLSGDGQYTFVTPFSQSNPGDAVYYGGSLLVPPPPPEPPTYVAYDGISASGDGSQVSLTRRSLSAEEESLDLLTVPLGGEPLVLTRLPLGAGPRSADIAHDGSLIAFIAYEARPDSGNFLYTVHPDGTGLQRLFEVDSFDPTLVSPDGQTIYFRGVGGQLMAVAPDGTNLRNILSTGGGGARISSDGGTLVFQSAGYIFAAGPDGGAQSLLGTGTGPRIDATGSWVVFESTGLIYRVPTDGTAAPELVSPGYIDATSPDISADGSVLVYVAGGDQIYLYDTGTGLTKPLTQNLGGELTGARISPDGTWAYFTAHTRIDEDDPDVFSQVFRIHVATLETQRWSGLGFGAVPDPRTNTYSAFGTFIPPPTVELDGSGRAVFVAAGNLTGDNPGRMGQVWLADPGAFNPLEVSGPAPTRLDWGVDPRFLRYDVVRGDLAQLREGAGPGEVVCLRNDSSVPTTRGSEDVEDPAPGGAFFYLYRGSYGLNLGSGTYGQSSAGVERTPQGGDCPE